MDVDVVMQAPGAQQSPLLAQLPPRELDLVLSTARASAYEMREPLYPVHAADDAVHIVLRGAFFEQVRQPAGQGLFAHPVDAGGVLGLTDVLISAELEREIRALCPSTALRIPGGTIRGLAGASAAVATAIAQVAVQQLRDAEHDRVVLASSDATGRVLRRISDLVTGWGRATDEGVDITLPMTQEQLGEWAGSSRETTVKVLQWLRERELIETSRRHLLVVDPDAITALATTRGVGGSARDQAPPGRSSPARSSRWPEVHRR